MSTNSPANTETRTVYLTQVLADIDQGKLLVPRFQRRQAWSVEQRLELLRSVRRNLPIGALLFWRTKTELVARDTLGPFTMKPVIGKDIYHDFILDGLQRIETLYAVLRTPPLARRSSEWSFVYDLDADEFRQARRDDQPSAMPLSVVLDGRLLLAFQRQLVGPKADLWIERADAIAQLLRYYQLPTVTLTTDDVELATTAFQRINSRGTKMGVADMLQALTWSTTFDMRTLVEQGRKRELAPIGWDAVKDETVVDTILAVEGRPLGKRDIDAASTLIKTKPERVLNAVRTLRQAAEFLGQEVNAFVPSLVPYRMQHVLLAHALDTPGADRAQLIRWFWWSTFLESFAGISNVALDRMAEYVRELDAQPDWPMRVRQLTTRPRRMDGRTAVSRGMCLLMLARRPRSADDAGYVLPALAAARTTAWMRIYPSWGPTPGNIVLAPPEDHASLRFALVAGNFVDDPSWLASHVIPPEAAISLREDRPEAFIALRNGALERMVREHLRGLGIPRGVPIRLP